MGTNLPELTFEITLEQRITLSKIELEAPQKTRYELIEALKSLTGQLFILQNNLAQVTKYSLLSIAAPYNTRDDLNSIQQNPAYREFFNNDHPRK